MSMLFSHNYNTPHEQTGLLKNGDLALKEDTKLPTSIIKR